MTRVLARTSDDDAAVDQAVVRLTDEFRSTLRPQVIGTVVRSCRRDLSGVPATALPELVERLARARLESETRSA
ncbi:three-helix bundle dimerization domain-containing protein [Trujillonella humicola]|uniref:three-helix bundle dimerization domain-containing protein n=1 Tax=Trujillonella humicola TaxID=3383699 RepID=UPI003905E8C9